MTLVIGIACKKYSLQVSDRRVTTTIRGVVSNIDDESNKAIYWAFPTGRLAVGYAGLASVGNERMPDVLRLLMLEAARDADYYPARAIDALTMRLSTRFQAPDVKRYSKADRRLSVILTGFVDIDAGRSPIAAIVSNYELSGDKGEAADEFTSLFSPASTSDYFSLWVAAIGDQSRITQVERDAVSALVKPDIPADAPLGKITDLLPKWTARSPSIGRQATSIYIPWEDTVYPKAHYHPAHASATLHAPDRVVSSPQGSVQVKDVWEFRRDADGAPKNFVFPVVPQSNPCPCGSGRRYRHCHGA